MRTCAGYFLPMKQQFTKKAISIQEQVKLLIDKGLLVQDLNQAYHCLSTVSYYRLSTYFRPFIDYKNSSDQKFTSETSFEQIWNIYTFDRKLRLLVSDVIERIEVALRASLSNVLAIKYGIVWYSKKEPFSKAWNIKNKKGVTPSMFFSSEVNKIINNRHCEDFIKHYINNYSEPKTPPSWMILECLSLGSCTTAFRHLESVNDKKAICKIFNEHPSVIGSWLDSLRYTRNLCAHHSRLWNRWFVVEPVHSRSFGNIKTTERSFHQQAIILYKLNQSLSPDSEWRDKLKALFDEYARYVPFEQMGFIKEWENDPFWDL